MEKEVPKIFVTSWTSSEGSFSFASFVFRGSFCLSFRGERSSWWRAFEPCGPNVCANALWFASNGKDGGRTSGVEDVPPGPEGEPADLQGSRDFLFFFVYLGLCVSVVRPRPIK